MDDHVGFERRKHVDLFCGFERFRDPGVDVCGRGRRGFLRCEFLDRCRAVLWGIRQATQFCFGAGCSCAGQHCRIEQRVYRGEYGAHDSGPALTGGVAVDRLIDVQAGICQACAHYGQGNGPIESGEWAEHFAERFEIADP
ncbi:hypothetical protein D3C71_1504650 [compost metagenome]